MFNFNDVELPESTGVESTSKYIRKPGYYLGQLSAIAIGTSSGGTKSLDLTFQTSGGEFTEKVYITEKTLKRIKYIFQEISGKPLTASFETVDQLKDYFELALLKNPKKIGLTVGGTVVGEKFYAKGVYFLVTADISKFEELAIEPNSEKWNAWVSNGNITSREPLIPKTDESFVKPNNDFQKEVKGFIPLTSAELPTETKDDGLPF